MPESTLDIEQPSMLLAYLRGTGRIGLDECVELCLLSGGVSNRTVLVRRRESGETWVIKQALTRLRVQTEWLSDPRRVHREAAGLRCLARLAPADAIAPFVFEDFKHHLLAMSAVPLPHDNFKAMLLAGRIDRDHLEQFATLLASIHRNGAAHGDTLAAEFDDCSFFESLRIEPYYGYAATQVPAAGAFLRQLIDDCRTRRHTLVHGDYSPKNVLVHNGKLVLLDHEVIHWGDGAFDVGFAMTHLLSKAHHLPEHRSALASAARDFWSVYCSAAQPAGWTVDCESMAVRHTLGCLLARAAGRSLLEYLDAAERTRQQETVVDLMRMPPTSMDELIEKFLARL